MREYHPIQIVELESQKEHQLPLQFLVTMIRYESYRYCLQHSQDHLAYQGCLNYHLNLLYRWRRYSFLVSCLE